jgi:hypothetical protein
MSHLLSGLYIVLGVVFGVSGWSKLSAPRAFAASLRPLRLVPAHLLRPGAVAITVTELAVALGFGWAFLAGTGTGSAAPTVGVMSLVLAGLLLVVLTTGVALALHRGVEATCACFGATEQPLRRRHLVRNGLLVGVVLAGLVVWALAGEEAVELGGAAVALAGGVVVALMLIRLDDLVELFAPVRPAPAVSPSRR